MSSHKVLLLAALVILVCLVEHVVLAASALTSQEKEAYRHLAQSKLQHAGHLKGKEQRIEETHLAVASLLKLGALQLSEEQKAQICALIDASPSSSPKTLHENVVVAIALSCPSADFSGVQSNVEKGLSESSTSIQDTYYYVRIVTLLQKQLPILAKNAKVLTAAFDRVYSKFDENTGSFCASDAKCTLKQSGYALEILSMIRSLVSSDKMLSALVKVSRSTDKLVKRVSSAIPLTEVSVFARGLNRLAKIVPQNKISREDVTQIANAILSHKQQTQLEGVYELAEGLSSLNNIFVPVIMSQLEQNKDVFQVSVSDVFGNPLDKITVLLSKVYSTRSTDSPIASNIPLSSSGTTYSWKPTSDILDQLKSAGVFNFDFNVVPETAKPNFPPVTISRMLIVETMAQVKSFTLSITGDRDYVVSYPSKLPQQLVIPQADGKRVSATVSLVGTPHQVFLRFLNKKTDSDAVVALKAVEQEGSYKLEINFEKIAGELFNYQSGDYDLQVIVGDITLKSPVMWNIGSVALQFTEAKRGGDKEQEAELYGLQKEIIHRFNVPEKRAPITVSSSFTIAVIAPLVFLLLGLLVIGFNFGNCPSGPMGFVFGLVFHGLIFSMLAVLFLYWIQLTIFQAFNYLGLLGLAAAFVGSKQLNSIAKK